MNEPAPATIQPRSVGAERALQWLAEGWRLFRAAPAVWIAITVVLGVGNLLLHFVPFLGSLAATLLMPVFAGGLMAGCAAQARDDELQFDVLFAGFKTHTGNLLTLGLLIFAAMAAIGLMMFLLGGGAMFGAMLGRGMPVEVGTTLAIGGIMMAGLLAMALLVPLSMAIWFAPPLVMLGGMAPVPAMKASFDACLKNFLPFLIYGVVVFALCFIAALPFMLGFLVLMPVVFGSVYSSYRDIFA